MGVLKVSADLPVEFELRPSQVPGSGMGVWAADTQLKDTCLKFSYIVLEDAKREPHVWEVYKAGKLSHYIDTRCSWIRYLQFARRESEATVIVDVDSHNELTFQIKQDLKRGEELLIKFSDKYAKQMKIYDFELSTPPAGGIYECLECPKLFVNPLSLTIHQLYHCGNESFLWCDECGQVCALPDTLRTHVAEHTSVCESSKRPFDAENLLKVEVPNPNSKLSPVMYPALSQFSPTFFLHQLQSLTSSPTFKENLQAFQGQLWPFRCDHCNKPFSHHSSLKVHQRMHTGEKPFKCDFCNKMFARRDSLQAHVRTHTKPFSCDKCGRSFARPDSLVAHARNHAGHNDRPFKCVECGKGFGVAQALQTHMRIHTGEKPFQCKHCPKAFAHMSSLKVHINSTHTGIKPFKCQHCAMRFADGSNLRRHIQTHTNEKPHVCKQCGKAFARGSILKEHMRTHAKYENRERAKYENRERAKTNLPSANCQLPAPGINFPSSQQIRAIQIGQFGGVKNDLNRSPVSAFSPLIHKHSPSVIISRKHDISASNKTLSQVVSDTLPLSFPMTATV